MKIVFFFFKQKTAYEMRISDWSSDVCSSDLSVEKDSTAQFTTVLVENFQEVGIDVHADEAPAALGQPLLVWPVRIIRRLWLRRGHRLRSEEHTSELQSLMRISYAVFCLKKTPNTIHRNHSIYKEIYM